MGNFALAEEDSLKDTIIILNSTEQIGPSRIPNFIRISLYSDPSKLELQLPKNRVMGVATVNSSKYFNGEQIILKFEKSITSKGELIIVIPTQIVSHMEIVELLSH